MIQPKRIPHWVPDVTIPSRTICSIHGYLIRFDGQAQTGAAAMSDHATKAFDSDLRDITCLISEMGGMAEREVVHAISALTGCNTTLAASVLDHDLKVDALQREIEEQIIVTIARRQPLAVDLREMVAALRVANDLERIGDLAKNVAKRVIAADGAYPPLRTVRGLQHITDLVLAQLNEAFDSMVAKDSVKALRVWHRDYEIDAMYDSLFREVLTYMMEDTGLITFGIHLLFSAKNIERIGDHATNIAEAIYYMVEGQPLTGERPKSDRANMIRA